MAIFLNAKLVTLHCPRTTCVEQQEFLEKPIIIFGKLLFFKCRVIFEKFFVIFLVFFLILKNFTYHFLLLEVDQLMYWLPLYLCDLPSRAWSATSGHQWYLQHTLLRCLLTLFGITKLLFFNYNKLFLLITIFVNIFFIVFKTTNLIVINFSFSCSVFKFNIQSVYYYHFC